MHPVTNSTRSESEVIERLKLGDHAAFEEIYRRHRRRVYSLCVRVTRNSAEAEELTQEVFLRLFRKIGTFRGEASFRSWLYRVALNVGLMHARHERLMQLVSLDEDGEFESNDASQQLARDDAQLVGSVNRITLLAAIQRLAPGYRMVLWLHDVLGYQHAEIVGILGGTIGTSKSQLHKARLKIRAELLMRPPAGRIERHRKRLRRRRSAVGRTFPVIDKSHPSFPTEMGYSQ
jgi:RNA polymerase sigma-70 factor (ECF subfamily)